MTISEVLRKAAARVRRGWIQGTATDYYGNVCALGAIDATAQDTGLYQAVGATVRAALGLSNIALWNDAPGQTAEGVAQGLERAADWWDDQQIPKAQWTHREQERVGEEEKVGA